MTQQNQAQLLINNRLRSKHHPIPIFVPHPTKTLAKDTHRYYEL
jgi:hypothetical protein